jgi:hypothetical protein
MVNKEHRCGSKKLMIRVFNFPEKSCSRDDGKFSSLFPGSRDIPGKIHGTFFDYYSLFPGISRDPCRIPGRDT